MNKRKITFSFLLIICLLAKAQDNITEKNKEKIDELKKRLGMMEAATNTPTDCDAEKALLKLKIKAQADSITLLKETVNKLMYSNFKATSLSSNCLKVYYDMGQAHTNYSSITGLDSIARLAKSKGTYKITIAGYADKTGTEKENIALSKKRAESLFDFLVKEKKLDPNKIFVEWHGSSTMVMGFNKKFNDALSRRAEVYLSF